MAESPLFKRTAGIGDTTEEAEAHFEKMVEEIYPKLAAGKVAGYPKAGRPAKNGVDFHVQVQPETKTKIADLSAQLGVPLGDCIEYLVAFHDWRKENEPRTPEPQVLEQLLGRLEKLESKTDGIGAKVMQALIEGHMGKFEPVAAQFSVSKSEFIGLSLSAMPNGVFPALKLTHEGKHDA